MARCPGRLVTDCIGRCCNFFSRHTLAVDHLDRWCPGLLRSQCALNLENRARRWTDECRCRLDLTYSCRTRPAAKPRVYSATQASVRSEEHTPEPQARLH